ncbi:DUF222 domain-containing protein [Hamadaea sp. NPDC051192]|uniref:HNH endonuclease signature motif containing protein n=1 Tax=Hamadaea sp. NPDC051192 TaxID=3154940 RepID=UPI003415C534
MFEDGAAGDLVDPLSDVSSLDGGARVDALCEVARSVAREQARLLEAMAAVAATSTGIGFDADEVAFALCLPRVSAQNQVALALDLTRRLPQVLAALRAGRICLARARVFSDVLMSAGDVLAGELADRFLPPSQVWTASQVRSRLLKALLDADPSAAKVRYERSVEERRVSLSRNDDTTACLSGIFLPPVKAAAAFERVDAIARGLKRDGEARTLEQLRADVFCDLLAGISPASGPIVRAGAVELLVPLATLAGLSDAAGTLAGYGPVVADIARQVAAAQAARPSQATQLSRDTLPSQAGPARERGEGTQAEQMIAEAAGGVVAPPPTIQWRYRVHDDDGTLLFHGVTRARPALPSAPVAGVDAAREGGSHAGAEAVSNAGSAAGPCGATVAGTPSTRPTSGWAFTEPVRGKVPGLPEIVPADDAASIRPARPTNTGPTSRPQSDPKHQTVPLQRKRADRPTPCPPVQDDDTARFPNAKLRSWVNARDVTCRAPGCTAPARSCDTDHTIDHADGGRTRHDNLGLLCRHHHRLKHEGGFQLTQPEPGHLHWTSPNGRTYEALPEPP